LKVNFFFKTYFNFKYFEISIAIPRNGPQMTALSFSAVKSMKGCQNSAEKFKLLVQEILLLLNEIGIPEVKCSQNRERIFDMSSDSNEIVKTHLFSNTICNRPN